MKSFSIGMVFFTVLLSACGKTNRSDFERLPGTSQLSNRMVKDISPVAGLVTNTNPTCDNLFAGLTLTIPGGGGWDTQLSCGGAFRLSLQSDGNLVLYKTATNTAVWATSTTTGRVLAMQSDGNLVLSDSSKRPLWSSGTSGAGNYLSVANGALTLRSKSAAALWTSTAAYLSCDGGVCKCSGINPLLPASDAINGCLSKTPVGWPLELATANYLIDKQIVINKAIHLTTAGSRGSAVNCYTQLQYNNIPCAQLYAVNGSKFPPGGMVLVGKGTYPNNFVSISNVNIDHIVINGNYTNRFGAVPIGASEDYSTEWNFSVHSCAGCSFTQGATFNSLRGEMAENSPYFQFLANTVAYHGNNKERPVPRNAACFVLSFNSDHSNIAYNYFYQCTDMGIGFDNVFGSSMAGTNVEGNVLVSRDRQYMTAGIHLNTAGQGNFAGVQVHGNIIDCLDTSRPNDAQCTEGIIVGGNPWAKKRGSALLSGLGAKALNIYSNKITGSNIGILVQFDGVGGNAVILHPPDPTDPSQNVISVTHDNADHFFQPWSCKQWQGLNPGLANCRSTQGKRWYQTPAFGTTTISNGSQIVSSNIYMDPTNGGFLWKDSSGKPVSIGAVTPGYYWGSEPPGIAFP